MSVGLAIFVKTPGYSPVKTRLAVECGQAYAESWYRQATLAVASVAQIAGADHDIAVHWAVAEPAAIAHDAWHGMPVLDQGEGGLGERMAHVYATLLAAHDAAMLIGADTPQLSADLLGEAADWLRQRGPRLALGPARDGGFWLFGGNLALPLQAWRGVHYSAAETARDLRIAMGELGQWHLLPELTDVDCASDLPIAVRELQRLPVLRPEQHRLLDWMLTSEGLMA